MGKTLALIAAFILGLGLTLTGCGGGGSSSSGSGSNEDVTHCVSFGDGKVINSCDFAIVVRTFAGSSTPVTVPANSSVTDPDANVAGIAGACRAPFIPVSESATEFSCD